MGQRILQVDAFTDKPFAGNPAAVCILPGPGDEGWMQHVAREMNLSETAFLYRQGDGFRLRWFTPALEVDLCGHATLASAHVLWEEGHLKPGEQARFYTRSGLLTAERRGEWIELNFPALPVEPIPILPDLIQALGIPQAQVKFTGKTRFHYLVGVDSEGTVRGLKPDFTLLGKISIPGIIVTSRSASPEYDFVSRFFAPGSGIPEDPVTGSAHCSLGPFWRGRLNKNEFLAYQASERGGVVQVRVEEDRVFLGGRAVTVLRGELIPS